MTINLCTFYNYTRNKSLIMTRIDSLWSKDKTLISDEKQIIPTEIPIYKSLIPIFDVEFQGFMSELYPIGNNGFTKWTYICRH